MNPVPKPLFLALALAAASAHAIPCPAPREVPEGEGIEASLHVCGALGVFTQHGKKGFFDPHSGAVVVPAQFDAVFRDYVADTLTPVMKDGRWAYVDTQGKTVQPFEYEAAEAFTHNWMGSRERECVEAQKKRQARGDRPAGQNPARKHTLRIAAATEHLDRSCRTAFTYTMSAQAYV